ncbi:hypothetical protein MWU75_10250 [Ornithinimicrobium sp. F0845]|uniref:hypothetical protein n=1 Tax=Ornithinimicrobium sp. F0845 TaxID=2926412 RepID=UPI001FF2EB4F|nr:hypothetical protein [Ornithinimicrobium sp. F0845]MCK0112519.1 hypothetical protein [Ornithinimicrobium sp. F0845]
MTYEILLYPRTPGQDWVEVLAADETDGPVLDQTGLNRGVATFRRVEARLRDQLAEPVRTWVAEELDGDVLGQLQTRDSGLRVDLNDRSASVSAPYGGPGAPVQDLVRQAVEIVAAETGYEAYDPQRGDTFDGSFDDVAAQASPVRTPDQDDLWAEEPASHDPEGGESADAASGAALHDSVADDEDHDAPLDPRAERARLIQERRQELLEQRSTPKALRRRGWVYVVFGVLLTVIAVMRVSAGQTDFLTWLFLGFGAFELVGAWLLFSQATRAEAAQGQEPADTADEGPEDPLQR